ncbi:MAG: DUF3747 domain-containing protein [Synechococcales cyanobacterium C42_A2020_086]|jgi:AcrR family transcriptional regulator|nr:DUF3747 domain-containing protein [Synechococcales cyanobacterium C42_A2020_086]
MSSPISRVAALVITATTAVLGNMVLQSSAWASRFQQAEVDQSRFVAIAAPMQGGNAHQLLILEQLSDRRPCWREIGVSPVQVDPLLTNFDFTGICGRSMDSNGYSIRLNGEDLGLRYSLRVVRHQGDMLLIGAPSGRNQPALLIGRTDGITNNFAKINLESGWRFTKRAFGDNTLGHVYLTYDGTPPTIDIRNLEGVGSLVIPPRAPAVAARFRDTINDIYLAEINQAVEIGFISGFQDNSFRPRESLTREQLVSMVLGALASLPNVTLNLPTQATAAPYSDVSATRWSAARIQFARDNNIVSGYQDGTFRPTQPVTRAELMAVLRRAAEYGRRLQGQSPQLAPTQAPGSFSDVSNHWANDLINQMASYCGVASPLNESGTVFAPDIAAQRNYAAAATLRTLNCLSGTQTASQ